MSKLIDYTNQILVTIVVIFLIWGFGYMVNATENRTQVFKQQCIEAGMQYVSGDCLK